MYYITPTVIARYFLGYLIILIGCFNSVLANQPTEVIEKLLPQETVEISEPLGEIALSLDDAPMPSTVIFNGVEKTKRIIQALQDTKCPAIGIFAIGQYAHTPTGLQRLHMYAEAGHTIANHSYSHYKLNDITAQKFIEDIKRAHEILSPLPNFKLLFRFPYLAEGKDEMQRQEVMQALQHMGYREGYITVNNHDYYIMIIIQNSDQERTINS